VLVRIMVAAPFLVSHESEVAYDTQVFGRLSRGAAKK